MHLLIDADSICYSAGYSANEPGQENLANWQLDNLLKTIVDDTKCSSYQVYLSGSDNFRYRIYPEYKANRAGMIRPIHLQSMREHLVSNWAACVSDGREADDEVSIAQMKWMQPFLAGEGPDPAKETAISHIDKDINMVPGKHYNPMKKLWYDISEEEGFQNFYIQLILGDKTDNIPGYDGKMRPKCPQFLYPVIEEIKFAMSTAELLKIVSEKWDCNDEERWLQFNQAAHCLWMQRKDYDDWRNYLNDNTMEELGLPVDLIRSLPAPFDQPVEDGPLNIKS